jgi:tRNA threonylcarbamoyladenosine biosynthesis protein TsaB
MTILIAVDTSTVQMGLALYDGSQVLAEALWRASLKHTVSLAPSLETMFDRVGLTLEDAGALGIAIGPGSFTSLRVGLSFVKGLSFARNLPVIAIPSLDILAASQPPQEIPLAAALQAGRGRLAVQFYETESGVWRARSEAEILTAESLAKRITSPTLVCGEFDSEQRRRLARKWKMIRLPSPAACVRRPALLAELAWTRWKNGETDDPVSLAPMYLHTGTPIPA